jgi:hypothetical protein
VMNKFFNDSVFEDFKEMRVKETINVIPRFGLDFERLRINMIISFNFY